jgi:peptidoglycan/LPS O-acetylase OafA/YrhL
MLFDAATETARDRAPREADTPAADFFRTGYIVALDGWRGAAILMVVLAHGWPLSDKLPVDFGSSGVTLFLIVSGFLITRRLLTAYYDGGKIAFRKFYIQRAFRILPPAMAYVAALLVLRQFVPEIRTSDSEIVACLFFWRNYLFTPENGWFTGHFWSLAVEEHFYLTWPLAIHLAGRKRALCLAFGAAAACGVWRWVGWRYPFHINYAFDRVPYFFRTDTRIDGLLLGSAMAIVLSNPDWALPLRRYLSHAESIICLFALGLIWLTAGHWFTGVREELAMTALLTITVLRPGEGLSRALEWGPLRAVGRLSYSIYIWQQLFLVPAGILWWNRFPGNLVLVFAAACASYFLVEEPARRFGRKLLQS